MASRRSVGGSNQISTALEIDELRTRLLGPISLAVAAGECVGVQGPSGSGKSLFLRAVVDLDPNEGSVRIGSIDRPPVPSDQWRRRVAHVPAESGWRTGRVADHFGVGCVLGPCSRPWACRMR
jgi:ABC-type bacteriocin/lantibiotic exporter with double-glycine peptidase domain